jgi:hypothetical protein
MLTRIAVAVPGPGRAHRRRVAPLALGVVVAGLIAGCGGDDKSDDVADFKKDAAAAAAKTTLLGDDLGTAISTASSKTDAQLTATFADLTTRAKAIVADLRALKPNDASRQKVADLSEALDVGATDLEAIKTAAANSDADAARSATEKLVTDSPAIKDANAALKTAVASGSN